MWSLDLSIDLILPAATKALLDKARTNKLSIRTSCVSFFPCVDNLMYETQFLNRSWVWGFHRSDYEEHYFLRFEAGRTPTFRTNVLSPYSGSKSEPCKKPARRRWFAWLTLRSRRCREHVPPETSENFHRTTWRYIKEVSEVIAIIATIYSASHSEMP
jgi:hypothetical protein